MAGAASFAIAGFTALGSIFDYPTILKEPTAEILAPTASTRAPSPAGSSSSSSAPPCSPPSACSSAASPAATRNVDRGRRHRRRHGPGHRPRPGGCCSCPESATTHRARPNRGREPHLRAAAHVARHRPRRDHRIRPHRYLHRPGRSSLTRAIAPRWMTYMGYASAALIATGVVIPLGVEAASLTNFVGYIAWCLWLIAMAVASGDQCGDYHDRPEPYALDVRSRCLGRSRSGETASRSRCRGQDGGAAGAPGARSRRRRRADRLIDDLWATTPSTPAATRCSRRSPSCAERSVTVADRQRRRRLPARRRPSRGRRPRRGAPNCDGASC